MACTQQALRPRRSFPIGELPDCIEEAVNKALERCSTSKEETPTEPKSQKEEQELTFLREIASSLRKLHDTYNRICLYAQRTHLSQTFVSLNNNFIS